MVGKCNAKPAVARLFVSDDTRGGGDVRLTLKGSGSACAFALTRKSVVGGLTAQMWREVTG